MITINKPINPIKMEPRQSQLTSDLKTILILVVIFIAILASLYLLDLKTDYLSSLGFRLLKGI